MLSYPRRKQWSHPKQQALEEKINNLEKDKSSLECEKLDPREEIKLAEEGFALEKDQWPEY